MSSRLLEKVEVVILWLLSVIFLSAALSNLAYGRTVFGWFGLVAALGLFPPLKFPLFIKILALSIAGLLLFT